MIISKKLGIPIVSRCKACLHTAESNHQMFLDCLVVTQAWDFFSDIMGIKFERTNISIGILSWWFKSGWFTGLYQVSLQIYSYGGVWEVWKSRNKFDFEGIQVIPYNIIANTLFLISNTCKYVKFES